MVVIKNSRTELYNLIKGVSSFTGDSLKQMSYADDAIAAGFGFSIENVFDLLSGTTVDFVFDVSGITRDFLVSYPTQWSMSKGHCVITLGVCDSYAGGSEVGITNRNAAFSISYPAQTVFKTGVTSTNFVASPTAILVGTEVAPVSSGGGSQEGQFPIWLAKGLKYIFRVQNFAGADVKLGYRIYHFEF